jgi:FkbM family methyltransferase
MKKFYSQYEQDEFLEDAVFKGFRNGIFVDVGAHDGISLNNTLYFEEHAGWTGINIEPQPNVYKKLCQNRPKSININHAVSNKTGLETFCWNVGYTEMLSGLVKFYDKQHLQRIARENKRYGGKTMIIKVPCVPLSQILEENKIDHIHYLSVDVGNLRY